MANTNPLIQQGTLNRLRTQLIVTNFPALQVTAPYLGKGMIRMAIEGNLTEQEETATGAVNSPNPFRMATFTIELLKTQALSGQWLAQAQSLTAIGPCTAYSDSAAYPPAYLDNASIFSYDPGAWDGSSPIVRVVVRGTFYLNNNLWALTV